MFEVGQPLQMIGDFFQPPHPRHTARPLLPVHANLVKLVPVPLAARTGGLLAVLLERKPARMNRLPVSGAPERAPESLGVGKRTRLDVGKDTLSARGRRLG
jgi:hypothetical protein